MIDIGKYFNRIHFTGNATPDIATLNALHVHHPRYIPFENIASFTGHVPDLEINAIFDKLVLGGRGGYCFEQNLLFKEVLESVGFTVRGLAARVAWNRDATAPAAKTHMLLQVMTDDGPYIADVGFGTMTLTATLRLLEDVAQKTPNGVFRITRAGDEYLLQTLKGKDWLPIYFFNTVPCELIDYEVTNWYIATHPDSGFRQHLMVSRVDEKARYSLQDQVLNIRYTDGNKETITMGNVQELVSVLQQTFGLVDADIPGIVQAYSKISI